MYKNIKFIYEQIVIYSKQKYLIYDLKKIHTLGEFLRVENGHRIPYIRDFLNKFIEKEFTNKLKNIEK